MRRHLLAVVLLAGPPASLSRADEPADFWHPDYEAAAADAEETGRALLIHFHADWCGPCRRMESEVLNEPSVLSGLRNRVSAVKVNYDRRADLVRRYNVEALPCDLLVAEDGSVLLRTTGYVAATAYVDQVARSTPLPRPQDRLLSMLTERMSRAGGMYDLGAVRHVGDGLRTVGRP